MDGRKPDGSLINPGATYQLLQALSAAETEPELKDYAPPAPVAAANVYALQLRALFSGTTEALEREAAEAKRRKEQLTLQRKREEQQQHIALIRDCAQLNEVTLVQRIEALPELAATDALPRSAGTPYSDNLFTAIWRHPTLQNQQKGYFLSQVLEFKGYHFFYIELLQLPLVAELLVHPAFHPLITHYYVLALTEYRNHELQETVSAEGSTAEKIIWEKLTTAKNFPCTDLLRIFKELLKIDTLESQIAFLKLCFKHTADEQQNLVAEEDPNFFWQKNLKNADNLYDFYKACKKEGEKAKYTPLQISLLMKLAKVSILESLLKTCHENEPITISEKVLKFLTEHRNSRLYGGWGRTDSEKVTNVIAKLDYTNAKTMLAMHKKGLEPLLNEAFKTSVNALKRLEAIN